MNYIINVSLKGNHYFATSAHSITDPDKLKEVWQHFKTLFPKDYGFKITASVKRATSQEVDFDDLSK